MTGWVILVDQPKDLPNAETPHKVITTSEYLARPRLFDMGRPKLVNQDDPAGHAAPFRMTMAALSRSRPKWITRSNAVHGTA